LSLFVVISVIERREKQLNLCTCTPVVRFCRTKSKRLFYTRLLRFLFSLFLDDRDELKLWLLSLPRNPVSVSHRQYPN